MRECLSWHLTSPRWRELSLKQEWIRKNGSWTSDFRILGIAAGKLIILSFPIQRQGDRELVDEHGNRNRPRISRSCKEQFRPKVTNGFVQKWRLAMMLNCNCERPTIILLCNFHLRFWRKCLSCGLQGEIRIGGLSHGRTAGNFQVKVLYRVILTYQPNGSRERHSIQNLSHQVRIPRIPFLKPFSMQLCPSFPPTSRLKRKKSFGFDIASC